MIKVSAISYLNTAPFIYGLKHCAIKNKILLDIDIPSVCADKLINGKADIGIVPVAILSKLPYYRIITNYCIGAVNAVKSVALFSDVPLNNINKIYLDFQSRTSVELVKILAKNFWKINPEWINADDGYEENIKGDTAGLVIGDRALQLLNKYKFVYDLAKEWIKFSGYPFVFACWTAVKELNPQFITDFESALKYGVSNIPEALKEWKKNNIVSFEIDMEAYLTENVSYNFDDRKKNGLEHFLYLLKNNGSPR